MTPSDLFSVIRRKKSLLCVGLDTDPLKIPQHLQSHDNPILEFNRQIIEATAEFAIAYKPNIAFYEALGPSGWETLQRTLELIPKDCLSIADAKRGDIGNTSSLYAKAFFETMDFDAITIAPYMGRDSVQPFLEFADKWVFLLALTSNPGAADFQMSQVDGLPLHLRVVEKALEWAKGMPGHLGFVTGATRPEQIADIRASAPESFYLVPGVGAQGGDLHATCQAGLNPLGGLLINASRSILYASAGQDFAQAAAAEAANLQAQTATELAGAGLM